MRRLLTMADIAVLIGPARRRRLGLSGSGRVQLERFLRRRMWRLRITGPGLPDTFRFKTSFGLDEDDATTT